MSSASNTRNSSEEVNRQNAEALNMPNDTLKTLGTRLDELSNKLHNLVPYHKKVMDLLFAFAKDVEHRGQVIEQQTQQANFVDLCECFVGVERHRQRMQISLSEEFERNKELEKELEKARKGEGEAAGGGEGG
jgi:hypothetical protein